MTSAPTNTQTEPRTVPRCLADIHRRQAVHLRNMSTVKNMMSHLAAGVGLPGGFWEKPRNLRIQRKQRDFTHAKASNSYSVLEIITDYISTCKELP